MKKHKNVSLLIVAKTTGVIDAVENDIEPKL